MAEKTLPFAEDIFRDIAENVDGPVYVYDEAGIRASAQALNGAFSWSEGYVNHYAAKAAPRSAILRILEDEGMGFDCSSLGELTIMERAQLGQHGLFYTSNNTPDEEFVKAHELGARINVDKVGDVDYAIRAIGEAPVAMAARLNPGELQVGDKKIGPPPESKFGDTFDHMEQAMRRMQAYGVEKIGLHTMVGSNRLDPEYFAKTTSILRSFAERLLHDSGIELDVINIGGGLGIDYMPDEQPADLAAISEAIAENLADLRVPIVSENGRYVTGPHGYLLMKVTRGFRESYESFLQVNSAVNNMARLASVEDAYHQLDVIGKMNDPMRIASVVGSMCAGSDKFAPYRAIPATTRPGDLIVMYDAGAHMAANATNYNLKTRAGEVMVSPDGSWRLITRPETIDDLLARDLELDSPVV